MKKKTKLKVGFVNHGNGYYAGGGWFHCQHCSYLERGLKSWQEHRGGEAATAIPGSGCPS